MEIYQIEQYAFYRRLNKSIDHKYHPSRGGNKLGESIWYDYYNMSYTFGDFDYHGNGQFTYYINRSEGNAHYRFYNTLEVKIDLEPIYRLRDTPYYNAGNKDFKYSIADYPYCYGVIGLDISWKSRYAKYHPSTRIVESCCSAQNPTSKVYLGPHPNLKMLPFRSGKTIKEWNVNYEHAYVGPKWILNDNQTYGEYYARSVYWWDNDKADEIDLLLFYSGMYTGRYIGVGPMNQEYITTLLDLINHFSKIDRKSQHVDWVCDAAIDKIDYYNLYGALIICNENTRGVVLQIPLTRRGPVGFLFLPFINPADGYYTPTPNRCDFDHFLWYHIPWEKGNCLDYLMFTDTEVAEEGPEPNQVKAYIATQRGHTRNDLPEMSDATLAKLDTFWGYGYHYRIDPERLFEGGLLLKIDSFSTFEQSEKSVFNLIFKETGVMFPIDGNELSFSLESNYLRVNILLNGPRSKVYFVQKQFSVLLFDHVVSIASVFKSDSNIDGKEIEYSPIKDGWVNDDATLKALNNPIGILDLYNTTFNLNVTHDSLSAALKINYGMFKMLEQGKSTNTQSITLSQFITNVLSEKISTYKWFCNKNGVAYPPDGVVNIYECNVLYNGPNTLEKASKYYKPNGLSNILILKPHHPQNALYLARYIMICYED